METHNDRRGSGATFIDRYGGWLALALGSAWSLFFYREILLDDRVYVFRDMHAFILPMNHTGHFLGQWGWPPLWNPLQSLGKPFAADIQNAVYYPITWLLRGLPLPFAFNLNLAIHHVLAAAGMYLLLRRWRAALPSCVLGALLFAFGGLMIAFDNMANALQSTVWLPWALLSFDIWLEQRSAAAIAGLAIAIGLTVLGAMPEVLLFANAALVTMAWDRRAAPGRAAPDRPGLARSLGALLLANIVAFGLCAAQLLPFLEYVGISSRAAGLTTESATRFSLSPASLLGFFLPRRLIDATGAFSETAAVWESGSEHLPWAITLYVGTALILVPLAWSALPGKRRLLWCVFGLFFAALAFGHHTPGYVWLLEQIPTLRSLRYPEKFLVIVHTGLAVAAAFGLEQCLRRRDNYSMLALGASVCAAACTLAAAVLYSGEATFARQVWAGDVLTLGGFAAVLTVVAFGGRRAPQAAALAIVALVAADLYRATANLLPTLPYQAFSAAPRTLGVMKKGESPLRIYSNASGRTSVRVFPESILQEHELMLAEQASFHGVANLYGPASINLADHEQLELMLVSSRRDRVSRLLASFNTAYLTSQRALPYAGLTLLRSARNELEANVYRVEDVKSRAYVPQQLVAFDDAESALNYLYEADDPAQRVAVVASALPADLPARARGQVRIASYLPDRVELTASMETSGLVVLSDSYYPGWRATVNGEPAEIVRANLFARGVYAGPGEQRIVYEFAPASHRIGAIISILTAALLIASVLFDSRRRR